MEIRAHFLVSEFRQILNLIKKSKIIKVKILLFFSFFLSFLLPLFMFTIKVRGPKRRKTKSMGLLLILPPASFFTLNDDERTPDSPSRHPDTK
jgi:hypothetical protein